MKDLHIAVANALTAGLEIQIDKETGAPVPPDPRILANAIAFLKNNGIVCEDDSPEMKQIKEKIGGNILRFPFNPDTEAAA